MNELEFKLLLNEKLCDVADAILHYYNPCKLGDNKCLLSDDMKNSDISCCHNSKFDISKDNRICTFLKDNGECNFRNIGCKLFLCATAIHYNPECVSDLKDLESIAKRYGLARRPFLGDGYVGRSKELSLMKHKGI